MPNWCQNTLKVMGDASEMKRFKEIGIKPDTETNEPVWVMSRYFPTPEPLLRTISPSSSALGKQFTNEWEILNAQRQLAEGKTDVVVPEGIPCANNSPEACAKLKSEYGTDEWYTWNVNNWGTKWDCDTRDTGIDTNEDTVLQVSFDSAWSPPTSWLQKVQQDFPTLKFKLTYSESGCGFAGMLYTGDFEEGEEPFLEEEEGEILYRDDVGEACHYNSEKECYVLTATGEPYHDEDGEIDYDFYPEEYSSCESNIVWFEK